jgi:glycosyltransferase involved in cell wall biosynthesis
LSSISKQAKVVAVIPFYNEEQLLLQTLTQTLPFVDHIIAVNDGSTDSSLKQLPDSPKMILINNPTNIGKGSALNKGFMESIKINSTFTITLDADLQHPPGLIPEFVNALQTSDVVIGNRLTEINKMPFQRRLSNRISSYLLSKKAGKPIIDSQCGYRAYRTAILPEIIPISTGYESESEILINAAKKNFKITFIPIPAIPTFRKSKIKSIPLILRFLKIILS